MENKHTGEMKLTCLQNICKNIPADSFHAAVATTCWLKLRSQISRPPVSNAKDNVVYIRTARGTNRCGSIRTAIKVWRGAYLGGPLRLGPPLWRWKNDLCWCHEHHNGSYRPSWSKTCSRMHQNAPFRRRKCQNFSALDPSGPPFHISKYATEYGYG